MWQVVDLGRVLPLSRVSYCIALHVPEDRILSNRPCCSRKCLPAFWSEALIESIPGLAKVLLVCLCVVYCIYIYIYVCVFVCVGRQCAAKLCLLWCSPTQFSRQWKSTVFVAAPGSVDDDDFQSILATVSSLRCLKFKLVGDLQKCLGLCLVVSGRVTSAAGSSRLVDRDEHQR